MHKKYEIKDEITVESLVSEPDAIYSYADYLKWTFEERVEIIKGKIFKMSPAPKRIHQKIDVKILHKFLNHLDGNPCEVYTAPFDVRFPIKESDTDNEIFTVVQPDICVICDLSKLDELGCKGAPDLIVEILSPSTAKKDLRDKYDLYQEHKVKEYWVVFPDTQVLEIFDLENDKYVSRGKFLDQEIIKSNVLNGFEVNVKEVFED